MFRRYYLVERVALSYLVLCLQSQKFTCEGLLGTTSFSSSLSSWAPGTTNPSSLLFRRWRRTPIEGISTALTTLPEGRRHSVCIRPVLSARGALLLSSIPEDDKKRETTKRKEEDDSNVWEVFITKNLPPAPENFLVLGGDVAALFTYSFLDHYLNHISSSILAKEAAEAIVGIHAVWMDAMPPEFLIAMQQAAAAASSSSTIITYAPAFHHAGICSVLFASCWLLSGYFHRAFSYDNTIFCSPVRAVLLAGRTWIFTAGAMLAIAFLSDIFASDLQYQVGGITRADADYIFDSLAVIVSWRFMIATILGRY